MDIKLTSSREEIAKALRSKIKKHNLYKYQAAKIIGISVATLTRVEDSKTYSAITHYLVRQWLNKKGICK